MNFTKNNKLKKPVYILLSCVLTVFIIMNTLTVPALPTGDDANNHTVSEDGCIILEYQELSDRDFLTPILYSAVAPFTEIHENALKLEFGENIDSIIFSYLVGNNWVEITDENNSDLPANTNYQFEITYRNVSVEDLLNADGQMVYEGLPEWFKPIGTGALLYEGEIVALIEAVDGKVVVTFDTDWLEEQKAKGTTTLGGTLKVSGVVDWQALPPDGGKIELPGLNLTMSFEGNLAQKYGNLDIQKSEPELVKNENGKYYLKYEITVTSSEDIPVPNVMVKDLFGFTDYISGYVGITPGIDVDGYEPSESSTTEPFTRGQLSIDGDYMYWDIGELGPNEVRTLTYYAEIAESYVDLIINNPIQNRADVYTKNDQTGEEYPKDTDSNFFTPHNDVEISKNATLISVDNNGNGTVTYTITITAPESNSFTLENLTLTDVFPDYLKDYISGDSGNFITVTVTIDGKSEERRVSYSDASFEITGLDLEPGGEITVTYTVSVTNVFFHNNGEVDLTNSATLSKGSRTLRGTTNTETLEKHTWARKVVGDPIDEEKTIEISAGDSVYEYDGDRIVSDNEPPEDFTVPKGSLRYQIVVNENGQWDLSSTSMKDEFDSPYLKYTGYVQIRLYEREGKSFGDINDSDVIAGLESSVPVRTIWLKVDDKGEFLFKPEELGISGNYAYLLTYYAAKVNMDDVGSALVTNSFDIKGEVGDGDGGYVDLPGIEVSVGKVVQGGVKYDAEKISWYYEPSPVYKTEEVGGRYTEDEFTGDYENGAIYWVIRLEGDIGIGKAEGSGRATSLSGFYVKDTPDTQTQFKRDSVVGVYIGPKDLNFAGYGSMEEFVSNTPEGVKQLTGNPLNDKWFADPSITAPDYQWYADNTDLDGVIFPKGCKLEKDQAVYIVLRTSPTDKLPTGNKATRTYHNTLSIASGGAKPVPVSEADYTYTSKTSLFKESKGAYIYDKDSGTFTNCSDHKVTDWIIGDSVDKSKLTSGTYSAWLLNVNWNGSIEGTADVIDYLPEGMELVYVDVNNFGNGIKTDTDNWPYTIYIDELSRSSDWTEMTSECLVRGFPVTTISYYNKETGEIRWRVTNLTASGNFNQHEINLRIICKVTDPDLFLNGGSKTYENQAAIWDDDNSQPVDMESATVTITRKIDKNLDQEALDALHAIINGDKINGTLNRLPFKLEINPMGELMCGGGTLPALIDDLSELLELVEDSLKITVGGVEYTNFTYTIEDRDGHQRLIIQGLPDGVPITISYDARVNAVPNNPVKISNIAYWAGYDPPDRPQVGDSYFEYEPSGTVFVDNPVSVEITKVDADSHSKRLSGAVFELYEVDTDGTLTGPIRTGSSDSMGKVIFGGLDEPRLELNTVYCIKEKTAPNGYKPDETLRYFVIVKPESSDDFSDYQIDDLDIWYESPQYSIVIENTKGTIGVEKVFVDGNGQNYRPTSGRYRFGLFNVEGKLLEILTIEYTENEPKYFLDDVPKNSPNFTKFEPEGVYRIYELDKNDVPITEGGTIGTSGAIYYVTYSTEQATVNTTVTVTNHLVPFELPEAGGNGTAGYYLSGAVLILISVLSYLFLQRYRLRSI